jgi:glucuronosyltransferase
LLNFRWKLRELLSNTSFATKSKELGSIFRDNLASPLDTAVYHTEYVMRHKGAPHLSPQYGNLYWFQFYLLDVIAAICMAVFIPIYILWSLLKCCCCRRKRKEKTN